MFQSVKKEVELAFRIEGGSEDSKVEISDVAVADEIVVPVEMPIGFTANAVSFITVDFEPTMAGVADIPVVIFSDRASEESMEGVTGFSESTCWDISQTCSDGDELIGPSNPSEFLTGLIAEDDMLVVCEIEFTTRVGDSKPLCPGTSTENSETEPTVGYVSGVAVLETIKPVPSFLALLSVSELTSEEGLMAAKLFLATTEVSKRLLGSTEA